MTAVPSPSLGALLHSFFLDHLIALKGLRPTSVRSYRDTIRLWLGFVAQACGRPLTRLELADLTFEQVQAFLRHLEEGRRNHIRTRNQRLAALHTFFAYLATRAPELLGLCQRVAAIPTKRVALPETHFLERDEVATLFARLPTQGRHALRDRALLLFLYNTGARAQEVADLRVEHLDLGPHARVRLHGKGDKWRTCPLWAETAAVLRRLITERATPPTDAVFAGPGGRPLTRFGIHKLVRRHGTRLDGPTQPGRLWRISPHVFRHTVAVHLLESGVEVNVIRGWLGHADLNTTNRYAEINTRAKEAALQACTPPSEVTGGGSPQRVWRDDPTLLHWLASL
jgi:site-specific recombinase XerD